MKAEVEVKILNVNVDEIRKKLKAVGAVFVAKQFFKRYTYNPGSRPENTGTWGRLRTDGEKTSLAVKIIEGSGLEDTKEIEVAVDDFKKTNKILGHLLITPKGYQENKRELWKLGDVEICIDWWPKIPAYLEIEAPNIESLKKTVGILGFEMEQTTTENTKDVFARYGIDIFKFEELRFQKK